MGRERTFSYQNQKLQMVASAEPDGWAVRIFFEGGYRASPVVYKIYYEGSVRDNMKGHPGDFIEQLMVLMRSNIESGQVKLTSKNK